MKHPRFQVFILVALALGMISMVFIPGAQAESQGPLLINAGGDRIKDSSGRTWVADTYALGGHNHAVSQEIRGTKDQSIFRSERWGMRGYDIPVSNGRYNLQLLFAELNPSSGKRVFSVSAESREILKDYEIASEVGNYRSHVKRFPVTVSDGKLNLRFSAKLNEPSVVGIELIPVVVPTTTTTTVKPTTTTAAPTTTTTTKVPVVAAKSPWKFIGGDEFNDSTIDSSKWALYSGRGNEGIGTRDPANVRERNGELTIVNRGTAGGGLCLCRDSSLKQTYGRYEFRAKMDVGNGAGPAALLWPTSGRWPVDGEIDMLEMPKGDRTHAHTTLHWGTNNSQTGRSHAGDFSQWHVFATEWTPNRVTFFIDGREVFTVTDAAAIPDGSMFLALQNDVGGYHADGSRGWITPRDPNSPEEINLHVDWVRIYSLN